MKKKKMIPFQEGESQHITVRYGTVPYCTVLYRTVQYHTVQNGTVRYHSRILNDPYRTVKIYNPTYLSMKRTVNVQED